MGHPVVFWLVWYMLKYMTLSFLIWKWGKVQSPYIGHHLCMAQRFLVCANVGWEKVSRNTCVVRVMVFRGVRRPFPSFSFTMSEALARAQLWRRTGEGNPLELRIVLKVWMQKMGFYINISRFSINIPRFSYSRCNTVGIYRAQHRDISLHLFSSF